MTTTAQFTARITPANLAVGLVEVTGPDGADAGTAILWATEDVDNALVGLGFTRILDATPGHVTGYVTETDDDGETVYVLTPALVTA